VELRGFVHPLGKGLSSVKSLENCLEKIKYGGRKSSPVRKEATYTLGGHRPKLISVGGEKKCRKTPEVGGENREGEGGAEP